jgi:hypothetical protein
LRISRTRQQLIDALEDLDLFTLISTLLVQGREMPEYEALYNTNIASPNVLSSVILVALDPQIAISHEEHVKNAILCSNGASGTKHSYRHVITKQDSFALVHPSSINYLAENWLPDNKVINQNTCTGPVSTKNRLFAYQDKIKTECTFVASLTAITPLDLVLLSRTDPAKPDLLAGWVHVTSTSSGASPINNDLCLLNRFKSHFFDKLLGWYLLVCVKHPEVIYSLQDYIQSSQTEASGLHHGLFLPDEEFEEGEEVMVEASLADKRVYMKQLWRVIKAIRFGLGIVSKMILNKQA